MKSTPENPSLVASTFNTYSCSIAESRTREAALRDAQPKEPLPALEDEEESNYFKSAQWTPDGTTLLTSSASNSTSTYILPPNLLDSPSPIHLKPYTTHHLPTTPNCLAPYPSFSLPNPSSTLYISTPTALPIRLLNVLTPSPSPLATYPLISPTTEAYLTPSSLLWSSPGTHFLTGTESLIALFDVSRSGEGPVSRMPTIPSKRHKLKGGGVGMRGIVSCLSHQPTSDEQGEGMLAAGTWTRWVGLYDMGGLGGLVSTWCVADAAKEAGIGGAGVSETKWSACGRYLCVVERKSRGVLVYDVRIMGKLVAWLEGRQAETNQRLGVDVFEAEGGTEVWAGGTDGVVRVWEGVGKIEGSQERSWEWKAHDDAVTSTLVHSSGTVVATCSGQRRIPDFEETKSSDGESSTDDSSDSEDDDSEYSPHSMKEAGHTLENSLKVWSL